MSWEPITKLKRIDRERHNLPGEHWLTLGAGVALWLATRKSPSLAVRLAAGIGGGLLVARAASGREIPHRLKQLIPHAG